MPLSYQTWAAIFVSCYYDELPEYGTIDHDTMCIGFRTRINLNSLLLVGRSKMVDAIVEVTGLSEIKTDKEVYDAVSHACMEYLPSENMIDKYCTYIRVSKELNDYVTALFEQQHPGVKLTLFDEAISALDSAAMIADMDRAFTESGLLDKCLKQSRRSSM